jgi:hypothetical protein
MLNVTYEAVDSLAPGRLAWIEEGRGWVRIEIDRAAPLAAVLTQLNIEFDELLAQTTWFQLWQGEVVSHETPDASLSVRFLLHRLIPDTAVMREDRGLIEIHVDPDLSTVEFAEAMNIGVRQLLGGGQWFQLFAGEIVTMDPAEYLAA